jgi:hypothetical protein
MSALLPTGIRLRIDGAPEGRFALGEADGVGDESPGGVLSSAMP